MNDGEINLDIFKFLFNIHSYLFDLAESGICCMCLAIPNFNIFPHRSSMLKGVEQDAEGRSTGAQDNRIV